ncbi:hypothetical protein [Gordonia amicalis]|uniref:hypothetical protein n=1 Tax=Gordonia amicalis TaxID=89053 RepID=UPI00040F902C|nr:hypothetical protein [Gordonia amicalis]
MFDEQAFQEALARPRLAKPAPEYLDANRGVPIRAISEQELQRSTIEWFDAFDKKLVHLSDVHGTDLSWIMTGPRSTGGASWYAT